MMQSTRRHVILPIFIGAAVLLISLTLLAIVARSPYSHANLNVGFDPGYTRTNQSLVGAPVPFENSGRIAQVSTDPVERGMQLFAVNMCASCHGLDGRGGIIGPSIAGTKAGKLRAKTQAGPKGMPAYAPGALSDNDLAAIAAYLDTMSAAAMQFKGEQLYQAMCSACHGQDRAGKKIEQGGQTTMIPALEWNELSKMYQTQPNRGTVEEQLVLTITQGKDEKGNDLAPMMPRWSSLTKEQVESLIQYLQGGSTSTGAAPAASASTMGMSSSPTDLQGEQLYQLSCAACHGQDRAGKKFDQDGHPVTVPELTWDALSKMYQSNPSRGTVPEQLVLAITKGQNEDGDDFGPMMPRWSSLPKAQVDSLIQYLQAGSTSTGAAPAMSSAAMNMMGENLYQTACAACHGADRAGKKFEQDGQSIEVPELTWEALTKMYQTNPGRGTVPEQLVLAITKGQNEDGDDFGPMMPRWSSLSKEQVDSLIQYLQGGNTSTGAAPATSSSTMGMGSPAMDLKGEQLYQISCAACHGQDRAGKKIDQDGHTVTVPELTWNALTKMYQSNPSRGTVQEQLVLAITKGQNEDGEDFGALMPRWSSLSKEQVDSLIQYLHTASAGAGKGPAMGSATMDLKGEQLYQTACAACHGQDRAGKKIAQDGQTITVPPLAWDDLNKMYQTNPSRGTVMEQLVLAITKGLNEDGEDFSPLMPRWSFLSKEQVDSLIQYLQPGSK